MKFVKFSLLIAFLASATYLGVVNDLPTMIEKVAPIIDESTLANGIGKSTESINVSVSDSGAGIDSLSVFVSQNSKMISIYASTFENHPKSLKIDVPISEIRAKVQEGKAVLTIEVSDASLRGNHAKVQKSIDIDFKAPDIAIMSQQHVASEGGAEFILFEARDKNLALAQARIDSHVFKAIAAEKLDPALAGRNIYAALLALPIEMNQDSNMRVEAVDMVGNTSSVNLSFKVKPFRRANTSPRISQHFINHKVVPLFESYQEAVPEVSNVTQPVDVFRMVNEDYRRYLQQKLSDLKLSDQPLAKGTFIKPMASATTSNFGEARSYSLDGVEAGGSTHDGLDLASVKRDTVVAANSGTVVLSGFLGIYGNAVVIDHGMGLTSLYGHLSSIEVEEGVDVERGQSIGRSGETGLAGGDHLHFEFRIASIPVVPKEWWDSHWLEDNIYGKLSALKEELGISK